MDRPSILEQGKDVCLNLPGELPQGMTTAVQQGNKLIQRKFAIKQVDKGRIAFITIKPPGKTSVV